MKSTRIWITLAFTWFASVATSSPTVDVLKEYVERPDPAYGIASTDLVSDANGVKTYLVTFDSLSWRTSVDVDRSIWSHTLKISVPEVLRSHTGLLIINGGSNSFFEDYVLQNPEGMSEEMAAVTGTVVSELQMIPNQPLKFGGDGEGRVEDDLIAYSWIKYILSGDPEWVAQFPMTKASVMGMNVIEEVAKAQAGVDLDGFVVAGASKRGWTSWLVAAIDDRVKGVVPIVIDVVNMIPSMKHHFASYGFWSEQVWDYESQGVFDYLDLPQIQNLAELIDPIYRIDQLQMPKFILNAANDEFFLPDSSQFYLDQLQGPTWLRYVPNSGHRVNNFDAFNSMIIFYESVIHQTPMPTLDWHRSNDWNVNVVVTGDAAAITVWEIERSADRDFRFRPSPDRRFYSPRTIPIEEDGTYNIDVIPPAPGSWKGYFVEVQFMEGPLGYLKLTTDVKVAQ